MTEASTVNALFLLTNKLKDQVKRKGWHDRKINRHRVESVADHIYGCQMLAYAMNSEFDYDIDIEKVILMLSIHEIGETIIGDVAPYDMPSKEKSEIEKAAVKELCSMIPNGDFILDLFNEFEGKSTPEAQFCYFVDKAECDLQAKLYSQEGCFDHMGDRNEFVKNFLGYDMKKRGFDSNFYSVLEYASNNDMVIKEHQDNNPIQNVISFYTLTNSLKDKKRKGEEIWKIKKENYGSVGEHIFSTQMLAIFTYLVYQRDIDIKHTISLLSTHELGENITDDICALLKTDIDRKNELETVKKVASILTKGDLLVKQYKEFEGIPEKEIVNENKEKVVRTKESIYSKYCDKLAPDIISKIYDQKNLIDLDNQEGNPTLKDETVKRHLDSGKSFSDMWILYGQEKYKYEEPFMTISNHALNNRLDEPYTLKLKQKGFSSLN